MKDALGRKIHVGDIVAKTPNGAYAKIYFFRVAKLNPKTVKLVGYQFDKKLNALVQAHEVFDTTSYPDSCLIINELFEDQKVKD